MEKLKGELLGDKIVVKEFGELFQKSGFGSVRDDGLYLAPEEALFLLKKERLEVFEGRKRIDFEKLFRVFRKIYPEIFIRYQVYRDLRDRGLVVRSGLKYGTHFRVYERGVRPKRGARQPWEHAKFLAHGVAEGEKYTITEISRFVRLAHSVKKRLWLGVVDGEGDVTYFQFTRVTP